MAPYSLAFKIGKEYIAFGQDTLKIDPTCLIFPPFLHITQRFIINISIYEFHNKIRCYG